MKEKTRIYLKFIFRYTTATVTNIKYENKIEKMGEKMPLLNCLMPILKPVMPLLTPMLSDLLVGLGLK
ncbi:MAG: hypothetical protein MOIL_00193 [Candidatus Methanolliviera sp. GoM_oil]|nr:MAG: hypothetical protein MOIL_00193 [Candidatus Methanolliviera sp. GoM_oil]VUT26555.1 MAG: hypothetical protein MASP_01572 [Candidatus Methanolliviera sp. GoM_asphalt]